MKYMGSKNRIAKHILPLMLKKRNSKHQYWVEPFVGGANMIDKVEGNRIGADNNKYLIALLKEMQVQIPFNPPRVDEKMYKYIKYNKHLYPDWLVGYVGFNLSFGAKFFSGYRRDKVGIRDYQKEAINNLRKQQSNIVGVKFICEDYRSLKIPNYSLIYCDPPYHNTTKYNSNFNHNEFWNWCRNKPEEGHTLFVSEYSAPSDFECIWEKEISSNLNVYGKRKRATEKLFICR